MAPRLIARPSRFPQQGGERRDPQGTRRSIATWRETPKSLEHPMLRWIAATLLGSRAQPPASPRRGYPRPGRICGLRRDAGTRDTDVRQRTSVDGPGEADG